MFYSELGVNVQLQQCSSLTGSNSSKNLSSISNTPPWGKQLFT